MGDLDCDACRLCGARTPEEAEVVCPGPEERGGAPCGGLDAFGGLPRQDCDDVPRLGPAPAAWCAAAAVPEIEVVADDCDDARPRRRAVRGRVAAYDCDGPT